MRKYDFPTELAALRNRIAVEHNLEVKYVHASYANVRPINIIIEDHFSSRMRGEQRREMRLGILSLWIGGPIGTTYDLTVYQCSTILDFLEYDYHAFTISERARRFLEDSEKQVEASGLQQSSRLTSELGATI